MRRTLSVRHDRFPLRAPFRIARGVKTAADVVTVTIAQGDVRGWGEGVPYPRYGETIDGAIAAIDGVRALIEGGGSRQDLAQAMPPGAARNAVDCALWDLEARIGRTNVAALASVPPVSALPSAITIGIDTPEAMAAIATTVAHVPLLKIKVNREEAAAQIAAVRAAAPAPRLIVDPNESWRVEDIAAYLPLLRAQRVDLLEQPVPRMTTRAGGTGRRHPDLRGRSVAHPRRSRSAGRPLQPCERQARQDGRLDRSPCAGR